MISHFLSCCSTFMPQAASSIAAIPKNDPPHPYLRQRFSLLTGWPLSSHDQIPRLFPDFSRHFKSKFMEYRPLQRSRYKTKCMLFLTAILIYSVITITTMFFTIPSKELRSCIFCRKQYARLVATCKNTFSLTFSFFPDFSLTTLKFPNYSRFSRFSR